MEEKEKDKQLKDKERIDSLQKSINELTNMLFEIKAKLKEVDTLNENDVYSLTLAYTNLYNEIRNLKYQFRFQILMYNN